MLVVADSSPMIGLVKVDCLHILPRLFATVAIPPRVAVELANSKRPDPLPALVATPPPWLSIVGPARVESIEGIDAGECEAIALAIELGAALLLIDDARAIRAARARDLATVRTAAMIFTLPAPASSRIFGQCSTGCVRPIFGCRGRFWTN